MATLDVMFLQRSIPLSRSNSSHSNALWSVAQLVERPAVNGMVVGSSPT